MKNQSLSFRRIKIILSNSSKFDEIRSDFKEWKSLIKDKIEIDEEVINLRRN
jgi:hypothetical protein